MANITILLTVDADRLWTDSSDGRNTNIDLANYCRLSQFGGEASTTGRQPTGAYMTRVVDDSTHDTSIVNPGDQLTWVGMSDSGPQNYQVFITAVTQSPTLPPEMPAFGRVATSDTLWPYGGSCSATASETTLINTSYYINFFIIKIVTGTPGKNSVSFTLDPKIKIIAS